MKGKRRGNRVFVIGLIYQVFAFFDFDFLHFLDTFIAWFNGFSVRKKEKKREEWCDEIKEKMTRILIVDN